VFDYLEKKLIVLLRIIFFDKCYKSRRDIRQLRKQHPYTVYMWVRVADLKLGHPVSTRFDWRLRRRINRLINLKGSDCLPPPDRIYSYTLDKVCPSNDSIEVLDGLVLNGNGRVFALQQAGFYNTLICVKARFK